MRPLAIHAAVMMLLCGCARSGLSNPPDDGAKLAATLPSLGGSCTRDGWCAEEPLPVASDLQSVWTDGAARIWVAGRHGEVFRLEGSKLVGTDNPTFEPRRHATEIDWPRGVMGLYGRGSKVWALGGTADDDLGLDGMVAEWDDARATWQTEHVGSGSYFEMFEAGGDTWLTGNGPMLRKRSGATWEVVSERWSWVNDPQVVPGDPTGSFFFLGELHVFRWDGSDFVQATKSEPSWPLRLRYAGKSGLFVGNLDGAQVSLQRWDSGASAWQTERSPQQFTFGPAGPDELRSFEPGGVWRRSTSGAWTEEPSPLDRDDVIIRACCDGLEHVVAVGRDARIIRWDGARWVSLHHSARALKHAVVEGLWADTALVVAVGHREPEWMKEDGGFLARRYPDGWRYELAAPVPLRAVTGAMTPTGVEIFAVGDGGEVRHYERGSWHQEASGSTRALFAVCMFGGEPWAFGEAGTSLRRTAGTWTAAPVAGVEHDLRGCWSDVTHLAVVGDDGALALYEAGEWRLERAPESGQGLPAFKSVWSADGRKFWIGGVGVMTFEEGRWTDTDFPSWNSIAGVAGTSNDDVVVAANSGVVVRWNGGRWRRERAGTDRRLGALAITSDSEWIGGDVIERRLRR